MNYHIGPFVGSLRLWKGYVHGSERHRWRDDESGNTHRYCCGSPLEARTLLDTVMQAMSSRNARALRRIVRRFDVVEPG